MPDTVLVIGGGIAGIQASLDLANAGAKVIMVERASSIGGKMAGLDKNFPTLDCSICIEAPKMSDVTHNPNIRVMTLSEVTGVKGKDGDFEVSILQHPGYVTSECTKCDLCVQECPQLMKNEFDGGMGARKAIFTPFSQAEPGTYSIDINSCLNDPPSYLPCSRCSDVCGPDAIDFSMVAHETTEKVGAIIVATGFDLLDPQLLTEFGYGTDPDILTSYEFERLLNAAGPSDGEIIKPSNREVPEKILFVLCAGSRDQRLVKYCSRTCCMYTIKEATQAKDHGISDISVLYMDIRAYGKGFDDFYLRSKDGVNYIRARPSLIRRNGDRIKVRYENQDSTKVVEEEYDLAVLATASIPSSGTGQLSGVLGIELSEDGFFKTEDAYPVRSSRNGIFIAGCASGPKDIPDSVTEGSAAAAGALGYLTERVWIKEPEAEPLDMSGDPRIGVFLCDCGSNINGVVNVASVAEEVKNFPNVAYVEENRFTCAGSTQDDMIKKIREKNLNRVVVSACSPKTHGITFQRVCSRAGLNPYVFEMANVRNMDSWVHKNEKEKATVKAVDLAKMAVVKARYLEPLNDIEVPVNRRAIVVGGGVAGLSAADALARMGIETHLIEKEKKAGGLLRSLDRLGPTGTRTQKLVNSKIQDAKDSGVIFHLGTQIENISGFIGNFIADLSDGTKMEAGAIVMATGAQPYVPEEFEYGKNSSVITSLDLEKDLKNIKNEKVTIASCVGSRDGDKGCSRFCCSSMLNQAIRLKENGNRVRVVYKDIRAYSRYAEELYLEAGRKGVQFFRYAQDKTPQDAIKLEDGSVTVFDELSAQELKIPTDRLVLSIGMRPSENNLMSQLKLSRDQEGFLLEVHPKLGPVEAAVSGVFLAGTAQGPKDVRESITQGLATATKAAGILFKDKIEKEPLIPVIDYDKCTKCQRCAAVCPYGAIKGTLRESIEVIPARCMGCGNCIAECAVDAITMPGYTDEEIISQIDAATEENPEEKLVVFACNWCSYAGADQAGISKIQYPSNSRVIRTMCSSRISQKLVMHAFARNAGAVLVTGCHLNDCHYIDANVHTEKRVERWIKFLEARGIDQRRLQLWWVSAAEGRRFASKITDMSNLIKSLPPDEVSKTAEKMGGRKW